jgi:type II secretory pathway component PulC
MSAPHYTRRIFVRKRLGRVALPLLVGAAAIALVAGVAVAYGADTVGHVMSPAGRAAATAAPAVQATPAAFQMAPLQSYAEVVRRPLFSPDRRPHETAQSGALPQSFTLCGIIIESAAHYALVQEGSTSKRVKEGEALGGGTVKQILRDQVVLDVNGVDTAVKLYDPTKDKPTPGLPSAGGIPSRMPSDIPPAAAMRPALSGG